MRPDGALTIQFKGVTRSEKHVSAVKDIIYEMRPGSRAH